MEKLEVLTKDTEYLDVSQVTGRPVIFNNYAMAAIFSPIFLDAKNRLKQLLRDNVIYADGLTPIEVAAIL